jgi:phage shock protein E
MSKQNAKKPAAKRTDDAPRRADTAERATRAKRVATWLALALVGVGAVILVAQLGSHSTKSTASTGSQPAAAQPPAASGAIADVAARRATLVDVRTPAEFAAGHAKGAINFDVAKMEAGRLPPVARSAKIYVYCRTGVRAGIAQSILQRSGYTDVSSIGGLQDWITAGGPTA